MNPGAQSHFLYQHFLTALPGNESVSLRREDDDDDRPDTQHRSLSEEKVRRTRRFGTVLSVQAPMWVVGSCPVQGTGRRASGRGAGGGGQFVGRNKRDTHFAKILNKSFTILT